MIPLLDDASLPADSEGLQSELTLLKERLAACDKRTREFMLAEDPAKGIFHAPEIHEMKKLKMMLGYQKQLRTARLNQLRLSDEM